MRIDVEKNFGGWMGLVPPLAMAKDIVKTIPASASRKCGHFVFPDLFSVTIRRVNDNGASCQNMPKPSLDSLRGWGFKPSPSILVSKSEYPNKMPCVYL